MVDDKIHKNFKCKRGTLSGSTNNDDLYKYVVTCQWD